MRTSAALAIGFAPFAIAQTYQIWDVWQTTWDRTNLYTNISPSSPINFGSPGAIGSADIEVDDTQTFQSVWGFGGSLTDSSAQLFNQLKSTSSSNYNALLEAMFDRTDEAQSAGLTFIRVPLGASDFSASDYSYDDSSGDTSLNSFSVDNAPSYLFSTLTDIKAKNPGIRIILTPWSPPGWMKGSGTMNGGSLTTSLVSTYANYLLKAVQGFTSKGLTLYAISIQNEPENSNDTYPTCTMPVSVMAQIGTALRTLLNNNGLSYVKIIGYDHNWDDAAGYPVQLMQQAGDAFAGVAFHCYAGTVDEQDDFHTQYPTKEIYFTECASEFDSDWWSNIKWFMDNLWIGAIEHNSHSGLMWNLALDGSGDPKLPGTNSCGGPGCRGIVTINSDGSYELNEEYYSMAQASRAILPRDSGGPWGKRIGVTVGGTLNWALRVGAYVTGRVSSTDWERYSLVVMNWDDSASTTWNPVPVTATIEFRDTQATFTFPVGVTTLWWYAPVTSASANANSDSDFEANSQAFNGTFWAEHDGQESMGRFQRDRD
ncbi:glycoside hydrolase [Stereum hirsutum FP-91666 SS1]|uniref:glycoside hydrolase n=1 Tax=Stereum hirsutum (strain FP-91666) TaxID=721885 RepID=UPI0004449C98|nr:glycoside hydrolase [Stereum hirsutum FP-91666 SS1]EIM84383.1 glycoside hydrolase [Stereum hirsutum FP-91666 SS1]